MARTGIELAAVRTRWAQRQGLVGPAPRDAVDALRRMGWLATAGSGAPYVALRARVPGLSREAVDVAIAGGRMLELPAVRGANVLVPAEDAPIAFAAGRRSEAERLARLARAAKVTGREIARLRDALVRALDAGPATAEELKARVKGVRELGEPGRKLGDPSTLGPALRAALLDGQLTRGGADGRLDSTRVLYRRGSLEAPELDEETLDRELAARFVAWAAPVSIAGFARWAGLRKRAAEVALGSLGLARIEVTGLGELWGTAEDVAALKKPPAKRASARLLPFRDPHLALRERLGPLLGEAAAKVKLLDFRHKPAALAEQESFHHHAIVLGARVVGAWEVEPETRAIAWGVWEPLSPAEQRLVKAAIEDTETFVHDQLGDLRFYALDANARRAERAAAVAGLRPPSRRGSAARS